MQVLEFKRGLIFKKWGLAFVIVPTDVDKLRKQLIDVKKALLSWRQRRGRKAEMVMFTVMIKPDQIDAYEQVFREAFEQDADLSAFCKAVTVQLHFPDERGERSMVKITLGRQWQL